MNWNAQVFRYCERGQDPSFWAEPLNAISNAAFLLAAVAALVAIDRMPRDERRFGPVLLAALVFAIGIGSFLFHTYATRWAALADVGPIGVFMLAYLGYALHVYARLGWTTTAVGLVIFVGALHMTGQIQCRPDLLSVAATTRGSCLNGTIGYAPALIAMLGIGAMLMARRHPAGRALVVAGLVFLASMLFRIVDIETCALTRLAGRTVGTHFIWHMLNALTLYLLLRAAIRHGGHGKSPTGPVAIASRG
jgi:hypothetical protein